MSYAAQEGSTGIQTRGAILLTSSQLSPEVMSGVINDGAVLTVTTLAALSAFLRASSVPQQGIVQAGGALVLTADELAPDMLIRVGNDGSILTVTTLGFLAEFLADPMLQQIVQSVGAFVLTADELAPNMLIRIVNHGPILTVTTLGFLAEYLNLGSGLAVDGMVLFLTSPAGWPTSDAGLSEGDVWANGIFVAAVPGAVPNPSAPPVFFGAITASTLLSLGAANFPLSDPGVTNQLWLNGILVCVSPSQ